MSKHHRMGDKQQHGHSRTSYFALRKAGLAARNKLRRIAKAERAIQRDRYKKRQPLTPIVIHYDEAA
jgi:hypothetical protein